MLGLLGLAAAFMLPVGWYLWNEHRRSTPSLYWPTLASHLDLGYTAGPPRIHGSWNGREVAFTAADGQPVRIAMRLAAETRLRIECGPKDLVTRRAGLVVPDPVEAGVPEFRDKLLARCSDKAAGTVVFDEAMQHRLAGVGRVDFVGEGGAVTWSLPDMRDYSEAKAVLGMLDALADALEGFPRGGARA